MLVALDEKSGDHEVGKIHPLRNINVGYKVRVGPARTCKDISPYN